jgi:hypothetical protein
MHGSGQHTIDGSIQISEPDRASNDAHHWFDDGNEGRFLWDECPIQPVPSSAAAWRVKGSIHVQRHRRTTISGDRGAWNTRWGLSHALQTGIQHKDKNKKATADLLAVGDHHRDPTLYLGRTFVQCGDSPGQDRIETSFIYFYDNNSRTGRIPEVGRGRETSSFLSDDLTTSPGCRHCRVFSEKLEDVQPGEVIRAAAHRKAAIRRATAEDGNAVIGVVSNVPGNHLGWNLHG